MIDLEDIRQDIFDIKTVPKVLYVYRGDTFELDLDLTISSSELSSVVLNCDGLPEATPLTLLETTDVSSKWHLVLNKSQTLILAPKSHNFTITIVRTDGTELTLYKGIMAVNNRVYSNYSNNYYIAALLKQTVPTVSDNDYLIGTMWVNVLTNRVYFLTSVVNNEAKWNDYSEPIGELNIRIDDILDGTAIVKKAEQDASGNVIASTYETKIDATSKKSEIDGRLDTAISDIDKIKDGTTVAKKAERDANNNVIATHYETKADVTSKLLTKVDKTQKIIGIDLQDDILLTEFKMALGNATQSVAGLLSAEDKTHLDGLVVLLESSDGNNIVDTISEILEIFNNYPEGADLVTALNGKVDKVEGKGLSTNDLTDILKSNYNTAYSWGNHAVEGYLKAITKVMVETVLTGTITSHNHNDTYEPANANIQSHISSINNPHSVTASQIGAEPAFTKNTAFNKNFGTTADTVAQGNHNHNDTYEPANANIQSHISSINNPHSVTKAQVGLSNVDNTSDSDKPISTAQQTSLNNKVDKNIVITGATKTKITYDSKGLVTAGEDLTADDIPALAISKITDFPTTMPPTAHQHTKSEITDFPTIPTIPDITVNNGNVESGKYISQVAIDETNKHKLNITKENLPTGFSGNYDDLIGAPTIPTVPTISTDIETDATSDIKTTSPKAVKTYVDNTISVIETDLNGKVVKNESITPATKAKITYDAKGLVTAGADLAEDDIPPLPASKITQTTTARFVTDAEKSTWNSKQATLTFDSSPTSGSTNPVTSGGVYTAISALEGTVAGIETLLEAI